MLLRTWNSATMSFFSPKWENKIQPLWIHFRWFLTLQLKEVNHLDYLPHLYIEMFKSLPQINPNLTAWTSWYCGFNFICLVILMDLSSLMNSPSNVTQYFYAPKNLLTGFYRFAMPCRCSGLLGVDIWETCLSQRRNRSGKKEGKMRNEGVFLLVTLLFQI